MYKRRAWFTFLALIFTSLFTACVSVDLTAPNFKRSESIELESPKHPFEAVESKFSDKIWKDRKSGVTISYLSECDGPSDPTLENLLKNITADIEDKETIESHFVDYNMRESLHSTVEGRVDGVPMRFELMIFKKNSCIFVLTYAAKREVFSLYQRRFLSFVKDFKVK